jgi:hypothetical protein
MRDQGKPDLSVDENMKTVDAVEKYRASVEPFLLAALDFQQYAVSYAQIAIRSSYLLNGGALLALPAYAGISKSSIGLTSLMWSAGAFVVGLLLVLLCTIVCHLNFLNGNMAYAAAGWLKYNRFFSRPLDAKTEKRLRKRNGNRIWMKTSSGEDGSPGLLD